MAGRVWRRVFRLDAGPHRVERDVDQEIAFHIEMRTRKLVVAGLSPDAARAEAVAQFGDLNGVRDECLSIGRDRERAMKWADIVGNLRQDLEYAVRSLRKQPSFTVVVLLILSLGIGANTATFTLIDALMLRPLPVPHVEQLVSIGDPAATGTMAIGTPAVSYVSYPVFTDVRAHNTVLSGIYATGGTSTIDVRDAGTARDATPVHPRARFVSGAFFSVLDVPAAIGRTFTSGEVDVAGPNPVVVISDAYWERQFNRDASVVGRQLFINDVPVTIIGVTPPSFTGDVVGSSTDIWLPMMLQPALSPRRQWLDDRNVSWLLMMGRLKPGVSLDQARREIATIETHSILDNADADDRKIVEATLKEHPIQVERGARGFSHYRSIYAHALVILMGAVTLVALVVCANVANLMLARSAARARELSVRMALGAGRGRIVQQLLTEGVLLAAAAGTLGTVIAMWCTRVMLRVASTGPAPIPLVVHMDLRTLAYTAAISLGTVLFFGLAPALRATRLDLVTSLRAQGRALNALGGRGGINIGKALVVAQVALSTLLLLGAGMLIHSMKQINTIDLGMDRAHLAVITVGAARSGYTGDRAAALTRDLTVRMRHVPGVVFASLSGNGLFSGSESGAGIRVPGYEIRADSEKYVTFDAVGPEYVRTVGACLLEGRDINDSDREASARVALVNQTAARFYFGNASPVGRSFTRSDSAYTIVGVVRDVEEQDVRARPVRRVYFSIYQVRDDITDVKYIVRTSGDPVSVARAVRETVLAADRTLTPDFQTVSALIRASNGQDWLVTKVISFFGVLTVVLAALGLYGLMAYATARRTAEFGIRSALGAQPGAVAAMIMREALVLTAFGACVGLPVGLLATRVIRGQLFGVGTVDVPSLAAALAVLACAGAVASYLPARRAARVGPLEALRAD